jgi:hypothetical protein
MTKVFQFSVRGLLVAVTLTAVGIAALLNASPWLEALAWGAALLILSCALLLVVYRRDEQRAFWLGFVVFGGIYLLVLLYSFTADWKNDPLSANPLHYNSLATTKVMGLLYESVLPESRRQEHVAVAATGGYQSVKKRYAYAGIATDPQGQPIMAGFSDEVSSLAFTPDGGTVLISGNKMEPNPSYIPLGKFISIGHTLWFLIAAVARSARSFAAPGRRNPSHERAKTRLAVSVPLPHASSPLPSSPWRSRHSANATPAWSHDLYCAAIGLLTLAIPLACYRTSEKRAFWAGFALCGWVYLLVIGNIDDWPPEWNQVASRGPSANVPTSRLTHWVYARAYGDPAADPNADADAAIESVTLRQRQVAVTTRYLLAVSASDPSAAAPSTSGATSRPRPEWWYFLNVGHALWTILLACLGGLIVRGIYVLRPDP